MDGRPIKLDAGGGAHGYLAYYKPSGEVTTREDPERRATVFERLPQPPRGRWISIGRLDFNTSGLLLLTTDGELAHRLMHPRYEIPREYAVRLLGGPSTDQLERLTRGVELDDGLARFDRIESRGGSGRNAWLHVTLREGRNREVRRIFEALDLTVSRLIRVRYGPIELGRLQRGDTRALQKHEIDQLYEAVGLRLKEPRRAGRSRPSSRGRADRDRRG